MSKGDWRAWSYKMQVNCSISIFKYSKHKAHWHVDPCSIFVKMNSKPKRASCKITFGFLFSSKAKNTHNKCRSLAFTIISNQYIFCSIKNISNRLNPIRNLISKWQCVVSRVCVLLLPRKSLTNFPRATDSMYMHPPITHWKSISNSSVFGAVIKEWNRPRSSGSENKSICSQHHLWWHSQHSVRFVLPLLRFH